MTRRTGFETRSPYGAGFLSGARFFRAPAAYRGGRAVFPAGNKQARGASSRCWVGAHLRKNVVESNYRRQPMSARFSHRISLAAIVAAPLLVGAGALATSGAAFADCTGLGAPTNTETRCLKAVQIPGNPLLSYDISWVNPHRAEYYLGDRSNSGIDIIDTRTLSFKRRLGGPGVFTGVALNPDGTVNNDKSGPDGVASHGRWLYAGDGNSTLKVFDLDAPTASALKETVPSGIPDDNRLDEMALTTDGEFLLTVNNAAEPLPFATLFAANGDRNHSSVRELTRITIDDKLFPGSAAIEQPAWDPKTRRFYVSVPILGENPKGCLTGPAAKVTCDGGMMVIDPANFTSGIMVLGAFDPATNRGVVPLTACGPNGATLGPHDNLLLGCTVANNTTNRSKHVINASTRPRTEASCHPPPADPTAPRLDRMTTCYWVAPWPTIRPTGARSSSTRLLGISSMWAGSSARTKCGSTKAMGGTTRRPTGIAN